jgi:5'(3')-deoxyribonucleotidase
MRILINIDGVCADFVSPVLKTTNLLLGTKYTAEDVLVWDMMEALGVPPKQSAEINNHIASPGFCYRMQPYPGVEKGLAKLRKLGEVIAVTSPFSSEHWEYERRVWLQEKLGFSKKEIISTSYKTPISGDFLVEDKVDNLVDWQAEDWIGRTGILFKQPWNVNDDRWNGPAVNDWKHLVAYIKSAA